MSTLQKSLNQLREWRTLLEREETPEMRFVFFAAEEPNAHIELEMPPSQQVEEWLTKKLDDLMVRLDLDPDEAIDVVEVTLDEMSEEGMVPEFPEESADEDEFRQYVQSVANNAGVLERFDKTARELFGAVEDVPGE